MDWGYDLAKDLKATVKATDTSLCAMIYLIDSLADQFPKGDEPGVEGVQHPHVTLFYHDNLQDDYAVIRQVLEDLLAATKPFDLEVDGLDYFELDDQRVAYARVNSPGLLALRKSLEEQLKEVGVDLQTHEGGYEPHATIQRLEPGDEWVGVVPSGTNVVGVVNLVWGSGESVSLDLGGSPEISKRVHVDLMVNGGNGYRIAKAEDERFILGIVLKPEQVDSQGDIYSSQAIREAAHDFLAGFTSGGDQALGAQHEQMLTSEKAVLVESYLAPIDMEFPVVRGGVETGEMRLIPKGTWLIGWKVIDDALWAQVQNGELTGFSIGGTARRRDEGESG